MSSKNFATLQSYLVALNLALMCWSHFIISRCMFDSTVYTTIRVNFASCNTFRNPHPTNSRLATD